MRQALIAGNWKMNGNRQVTEQLISEIQQGLAADACEVAVIPPFTYLDQAQQLLVDSPIKLGAQNLCSEVSGTFTGEVSGNMLKDMGCHYVLVGHSERRTLYGESNEVVAEKFIRAQQQGLVPILCVGETLAQREQKQTLEVVLGQVDAVVKYNSINVLANAVIAYEPVWAIGTGLTALPEQAQQVHQALRQSIAEQHEEIAQNVRILYGGSMKPANAADLLAMKDIDGGLIGGASLKSADFLAIINEAR